jgi:hypothetical protein
LAADLESSGRRFSLGEIIQACQQLEEHGLVKIKHRIFVHPTEYGERLISVLTGEEPAATLVPALPSPPA